MKICRFLLKFLLIASPFQGGADIGGGYEVSLGTRGFLEKTRDGSLDQQQVYIQLKPEFKVSPDSSSTLEIEGLYQNQLGVQTAKQEPLIDLKKGLWRVQAGSWSLSLGAQTVNWGVLDVYSPLDRVNQKSWISPLSPQKLGAAGLQLTWSDLLSKAELFYIPRRRRAVFPGEHSRWLPRDVIINTSNQTAEIELPDSINYSYRPPVTEEGATRHNFGFRSVSRWGGLDLHFVYFRGLRQTPSFGIEATLVPTAVDPETGDPLAFRAESDVGLRPILVESEIMGMGGAWVFGRQILRWEAAYETTTDPSDFDNKLRQKELGVSLERPVTIGEQSVRVVLNHYMADKQKQADNLFGSSHRIFDDASNLGLRWAPNTRDSVTTGYLHNWRDHSSAIMGEVIKHLSTHWQIRLEAVFLQGSQGTLLGTYKKNDYVFGHIEFLY